MANYFNADIGLNKKLKIKNDSVINEIRRSLSPNSTLELQSGVSIYAKDSYKTEMISHNKACALIKVKESNCRNAPNIELLNPRDHVRKVNSSEIE